MGGKTSPEKAEEEEKRKKNNVMSAEGGHAIYEPPIPSDFIAGNITNESLRYVSIVLELEYFTIFRCVLVSLQEGLSVRPYVSYHLI